MKRFIILLFITAVITGCWPGMYEDKVVSACSSFVGRLPEEKRIEAMKVCLEARMGK